MGRNIFYWWFVSILFELGRWPDILLILSDWIQKPVTAVLGGFETPAVYDVKMPSEGFQTAFGLEGYFIASLIALILWRYMPM